MRVKINDKEVIIPSSLSEITIGQRIEFHNQYGRQLDEMLDSIQQMKDEYFKELELIQWHAEKMYRTFAFFAGTSPEALKASKFIDEISNIYYSCLHVLMDEEQKMELQHEFIWKDQEWQISPPEVKRGDKMTFGELIDAKQIIQNMVQLGRGKWEYMVRLCAIYLRKKGEQYDESFLFDDSDRLKMMYELPMNIAMQVGFFLTSTLSSWMNTSTFSEKVKQRRPAII